MTESPCENCQALGTPGTTCRVCGGRGCHASLEELAAELAGVCTRDDYGNHFTEWLDWQTLEVAGLVTIDRPRHESGIEYAAEDWRIEVTDRGTELLEEFELID